MLTEIRIVREPVMLDDLRILARDRFGDVLARRGRS
jgi:hypothetical protein